MKFNIKIIFIINSVLVISVVYGQEKMSLEKAIEITLKNNYDIILSKNQNEIENNNFSIGNAGILPQIGLSATKNLASNNTQQHYSSGLEVNKKALQSQNLNSGIFLNWTLFDGLKMFASYDKLRELKNMGELQSKINMENVIATTMNAYYYVVSQKQLIQATLKAIEIYREREKIAALKLEIGSGSKLDLLQAKVDLNAQRSLLLQQKNNLTAAKIKLNQLMAQAPNGDFDVEDSITNHYNPSLEDLKTSSQTQNYSVLFAERNMKEKTYLLREIRSQYFPQLGFNMNYNFTRTENQAGFLLLNQALGLNMGVNLSWNLFNGSYLNTQRKNAAIGLANAQLNYEATQLQVSSDVYRAFQDYMQVKESLQLESENEQIAKENATIAIESFRIGKISSLDLNMAQKSLEDAESRLINASYQAKSAEIELLRLSGKLIK